MRILVADDDDMVRLVIREILSGKRHTLEEACDGYEVMQMCSESKFDLILMDHHMPGLNGIEAARKISSQCAVRIILLTGSSRLDETPPDLQVLRKPFGAEELLSLL